MDGVLIPKYVKGLVVARLFYVAMGGQIFARRIPCYEILSRKKSEGARIITSGEMDLGQPEGILVVVFFVTSVSARLLCFPC